MQSGSGVNFKAYRFGVNAPHNDEALFEYVDANDNAYEITINTDDDSTDVEDHKRLAAREVQLARVDRAMCYLTRVSGDFTDWDEQILLTPRSTRWVLRVRGSEPGWATRTGSQLEPGVIATTSAFPEARSDDDVFMNTSLSACHGRFPFAAPLRSSSPRVAPHRQGIGSWR